MYTSSIRKREEKTQDIYEPEVYQSCDVAQSDTPLAQKSVRHFKASDTPRSSHGELQDEDIEEKSVLSTMQWTQRLADSPNRIKVMYEKVA